MWYYDQSSGALSRNGKVVGTGYSGLPPSRNKPQDEAIKGQGPIPAGLWHIGSVENDHPNIGPVVMALTPVGHNAHGRSAFFMHGDSVSHPGYASHGCIIMLRAVREAVAASGDHDLTVVP